MADSPRDAGAAPALALSCSATSPWQDTLHPCETASPRLHPAPGQAHVSVPRHQKHPCPNPTDLATAGPAPSLQPYGQPLALHTVSRLPPYRPPAGMSLSPRLQGPRSIKMPTEPYLSLHPDLVRTLPLATSPCDTCACASGRTSSTGLAAFPESLLDLSTRDGNLAQASARSSFLRSCVLSCLHTWPIHQSRPEACLAPGPITATPWSWATALTSPAGIHPCCLTSPLNTAARTALINIERGCYSYAQTPLVTAHFIWNRSTALRTAPRPHMTSFLHFSPPLHSTTCHLAPLQLPEHKRHSCIRKRGAHRPGPSAWKTPPLAGTPAAPAPFGSSLHSRARSLTDPRALLSTTLLQRATQGPRVPSHISCRQAQTTPRWGC